MAVLGIMLGTLGLFWWLGRWYADHLARVFGEQRDRPTASLTHADGRDYVPTTTPVVFAHHFASIAGAGPIIGPIIGLIFGWLPALLWILFGALLFGAVHDYAAMFVSNREGGQSIATVARRALGRDVFQLFLWLIVMLMVLVTGVFLKLSGQALLASYKAVQLNIIPGESWIQLEGDEVRLGGISSTSILFITLFAPLIGWLYLKKQVSTYWCSLLAIIVCVLSVYVGLQYPLWKILVNLSFTQPVQQQQAWMIFLCGYCLLAAGLPVWIFLSSRDFINVHMLYAGIALLVVSLFAAGLRGLSMDFPWFVDYQVELHGELWMIWPLLFINIACGACSGFHSLCASGTTVKQLNAETAVRQVGYYGMLLESFLAVCVVLVCTIGLTYTGYQNIMIVPAKSNPILAFAIGVGKTAHLGLGLPVEFGIVFAMLMLEGFMITTLDSAVRLSRYLLQEFWRDYFLGSDPAPTTDTADSKKSASVPLEYRVLSNYWLNTLFIVLLMYWVANSERVMTLWKLFGSGNQLLAGLALFVASCWFWQKGRSGWYTFVPAVFMLATTLTSLVQQATKFWQNRLQTKGTLSQADDVLSYDNIFLAGFAWLLFCMVSAIILITVVRWFRTGSLTVQPASAPAVSN